MSGWALFLIFSLQASPKPIPSESETADSQPHVFPPLSCTSNGSFTASTPSKRRLSDEIEIGSKRAKQIKASHIELGSKNPILDSGDEISYDKVDWRNRLCELFEAGPETTDSTLLDCLNRVAGVLKPLVAPVEEPLPEEPVKASCQVLHKTRCSVDRSETIFLDQPHMVGYGQRPCHLGGKDKVSNMELFIERHRGLSFIIIKEYNCCVFGSNQLEFEEQPVPSLEMLQIVHEDLCEVLNIVKESSTRGKLFPEFKLNGQTMNPHIWFFHEKASFISTLEGINQVHGEHLALFMEYMILDKGNEFTILEKQLSEKVISREYLEYLFVSNLSLQTSPFPRLSHIMALHA